MKENFELHIESLIIEVTRMCNMSCDFCLRGKQENVSITNEIIDKALNEISSIREITFTGGEPTLNAEAIIYIINQIMQKRIPVLSFFMATNGKEYSKELVAAFIDFYAYCISCNGYEDDCIGGIAVSQDQYHDDIDKTNLMRYKALSFYSDSKNKIYKDDQILSEGMAYENGIGDKSNCFFSSNGISIENALDDGIYVDTVYLNANGGVTNDSDMSYDTQEDFLLGNVLDKSLVEIILTTSEEIDDDYVQKILHDRTIENIA